MKKLLFYFVCISIYFFFYVSCSSNSSHSKESDGNGFYIINLDSAENSYQTFLYSSIYKNIKTTILETDKSCLIGWIDKIRIYDQHFYILDSNNAKSLFVFDKDGRFIRKIGSVGPGPGEFENPSDFTIDTKNKTIYLLDDHSQRINKYSLISGDFISSINLDKKIYSHNIEYFNGKLYADAYFYEHKDDNYLLRVISEPSGLEDGQYINVMEYNKGLSNTTTIFRKPFYFRENGNLVFVQQFMDHIIEISEESISPLFTIKSNDLFTSKDLKEIEEIDIVSLLRFTKIFKSKKFHDISDFIEHDNLVIFSYIKGGIFTNIIFNKQTNKVDIIYQQRDDLLLRENNVNYPYLNIKTACYDKNGVYFFIRSEFVAQIKKMAQENALTSNLDKLENIKTLDDDANPIIFYYEFK